MCGIVGVWGNNEATEASILAYLGSYAQQNRGQAGTGIVSSEGKHLYHEAGIGLVREFFTKERLARLPGHRAIGHNRYATTGSSSNACNVQPLVARNTLFGDVAIAHNGNLVNTAGVQEMLANTGVLFTSTTDTEIILQLIATSKADLFLTAVCEALAQVQGAFSLVIMNATEMIAVRDPHGFRPLCIGKISDGGYVFASETCALDLIEAEYVRDLLPGEVVHVSEDKMMSSLPFEKVVPKQCFFELVYFARPDGDIFGSNVYLTRKALGRQLAREAPVDADIVVPVPDSGVPAAMGYSEESGIPLELALTRNHYVGRTFIEPTQGIRHFGVKIKHNPIRRVVAGRRVVVVDDSIVRGTTSRKLIAMIRYAGATEVHMRVSSPPPKEICRYGIDTPTREEYIANRFTLDGIQRYIDADSLQYLSYDGMLAVTGKPVENYCTTCWTGKHPIKIL